MKVTSQNKDLIQLTKWGIFNCYLIKEDDGLTLVDRAMPKCGALILQAAQAQGLPIKRMVLTHAHVDHVGAL